MRFIPRLLGVLVLATAAPAVARFAWVPAERVDEVPVERLLANLKRNTQRLPEDHLWMLIGRVHLLAYIRNSERLPVYRDRPGKVAEGEIGDCAAMDRKSPNKPADVPFPVRRPGELCEARSYGMAWYREVPVRAHDDPRRPSKHLNAAIEALSRAKRLPPRAKRLPPDDFRPRLSLAFALDRALRLDEARSELRPIVIWGIHRTARLPGYQLETLDWETYATLSEAADHLARIPADGADRQDAVTLKRQLGAPPPRMVTPILVPLKTNVAFEDLVARSSDVAFDFTGQGPAQSIGWLTGDAAWLVWDPKRNGQITSGFQLFGSVTWIAFWDNGYHALGSLDDNGDGRIAGSERDGLALWQDKNGDGVSQKSEVRPVADYGIVALGYAHERIREDLWISRVGATFVDGEVRPTYDWVLRAPPVTIAKAPDAGDLSAGVRSPVGRGRLHPTTMAE